MKTWLWFATVLFVGALRTTVPAEEFRGLWVESFGRGFLDKEQVQQLAAQCRQYHFNAVFVQVRKRGDAYYLPHPPNTEPRADNIAPDFDALAEIIRVCHEQQPRIEVHAWVVAYFVWAWDKPPRVRNIPSSALGTSFLSASTRERKGK